MALIPKDKVRSIDDVDIVSASAGDGIVGTRLESQSIGSAVAQSVRSDLGQCTTGAERSGCIVTGDRVRAVVDGNGIGTRTSDDCIGASIEYERIIVGCIQC